MLDIKGTHGFTMTDLETKEFPFLANILNYKPYGRNGFDNTSILETIIAFVESGFNVAKACEKLFIHRNTFVYRLGIIVDVSCLDTDVPENMLMLYFAAKKHVEKNGLPKLVERIKGVYFNKRKNKYEARPYISGKNKSLGYFETKEEAVARIKDELASRQAV